MDAKLKHYAIEIVRMAKEDRKWRNGIIKGATNWADCPDDKNTDRMKQIVREIGWPSIPKVGPAASTEAWLLVQHADHDKSGFQAKCLALMKELPEGEVDKHDIAYLEDRVRSNSGQPLLYGTQFRRNQDDEWEVLPTEDVEHLDERRASMGLEPFSIKLAGIKKRYKNLR